MASYSVLHNFCKEVLVKIVERTDLRKLRLFVPIPSFLFVKWLVLELILVVAFAKTTKLKFKLGYFSFNLL